MNRILLTVAAVLAISPSVFSKDLSHRLGVGYRNAFSFDLPSLAAHYYPNTEYGLVTALGIDTKTNDSKFAFTGGVRKIVFKEDNMNFFFSGLLSLLNTDNGVDKKSGFELGATVGAEFFLAGLDSLGFNMETGVAVTNIDKVRFRTIGTSFLGAGIVFYF